MKRTILIVTLAACAAIGVGCGKKHGTASSKIANKEVVVSVNGVTLTRGRLNAAIDKLVAAKKIPPESLDLARRQFGRQLAQDFIKRTLLLEEAKNAKIGKVTPEMRKARKDEIVKELAARSGGPKTFDEYISAHPLGKKYAMREFEEGMLINQFLVKTVISKLKPDSEGTTAKEKDAAILKFYESIRAKARISTPGFPELSFGVKQAPDQNPESAKSAPAAAKPAAPEKR